MSAFGRWSLKGGPKEINWVIGCRTEMSMKNAGTWAFAYREIGRLWTKWGWILAVVSLIVLLPVIGRGEELIGCIFPVEKKLRKTVDRDGKRKEG